MEYQEKGPLMICNHRVWLAVAVRAEDRDVVMEMEVCVVYVCEKRERELTSSEMLHHPWN